MIVVCISLPKGFARHRLTIGKQYDATDGVVSGNKNSYWIVFDDGRKNTIAKKHFSNISFLRDKKLEELGII